ncbi:hypothetical protein [Calothrix sp. PCC 6303]|uniref:hypothetical protein n=1 Tax=Calothrix sp. PCC 6303 TaxID=1170562 RepID=UPI0002A02599|nr:hypothetical protein [Calothrix sp. PCC 6303]AFZ01822.1 hypothetical protein Cal6303_2864 [Calothrix sp. PCC 6303]
MQRKKSLLLNFVFVCLLAFLMIRDHLPSPYFELSIITKDNQSITVPSHLIYCRFSQNLHCEIPIIRQNLVIEEVEPSYLKCRARLGKQTPTCRWSHASALEYIEIESLELTPIEIAAFKYSIKPFPTARIFDDPAVNVSLLALLWGLLSVWSVFNVVNSVFFYSRRFFPDQNDQTKRITPELLAAIAGLGIIIFLAFSFLFLIMVFGYVD